MTQNFNTKVSSVEEGGLYSSATVKAWGGTHKGVDIAMPQGTKLPCPVDGEVVAAGKEGGWGGTLVIRDSKGAEIRLSHLSALLGGLRPGMKVERGQLLALSGGRRGTPGAGTSTGPHLDLRVKIDGNYVDPESYLPT